MTQVERLTEMEENSRRMQARLDDLERRQKELEARLEDGDLTATQQVDVREIAHQWHLEQLAGKRPRRRAGGRR